jgi:hypothetical protein
MKINAKLLLLASIALGWLIFSILLYFTYKEGKNNLTDKIIDCVQDAINTDYQERLNKILVLYRPTGRKIKGFQIESEDGIETISFNEGTNQSAVERLCNQYVLSKILPPSPDEINDLLKNKLKRNGVENVRTGIIYSNNGKSFFSNSDSTYSKSSIILPTKYIDIKKAQSIQAWATVPYTEIIKIISPKSFWSVVTYFIVLFIVSISSIKGTKHGKQINRSECIEMGNMILNLESQNLYINGNLCQLTPIDFRLLLLFINSPNKFVTKENIKNKFWPTEENSDSKIHTHISTLKSSLKDYPEYTIITEINKGYRFNVKE